MKVADCISTLFIENRGDEVGQVNKQTRYRHPEPPNSEHLADGVRCARCVSDVSAVSESICLPDVNSAC